MLLLGDSVMPTGSVSKVQGSVGDLKKSIETVECNSAFTANTDLKKSNAL